MSRSEVTPFDFAEAAISLVEDELIETGQLGIAMHALSERKRGKYDISGFADLFDMITTEGHDAFRDQFFKMIAEKKRKYIRIAVVSIDARPDDDQAQQQLRVAVEFKSGESAEFWFEFHVYDGKLLLGKPIVETHKPRVFR